MTDVKHVDIDGIQTSYVDRGTGSTIVFIHGGAFDYRHPTSHTHWTNNLDLFASRYRVVAPDKLGAGGTDNPRVPSDYTMQAVMEHLWRFLEVTELGDVVLIGHSRGALPAVRLAMDHPDRVRACVLIDSNTLAPEDPVVPLDFYERYYPDPLAVPTREAVSKLLEANLYVRNDNTERAVARELDELDHPDPRRPLTATAIRQMFERTTDTFLPSMTAAKYQALDDIRTGQLRVPTLVVWGLNDPSAPLKIGVHLFEIIGLHTAHAEMHVFNESGHAPHVAYPSEFFDVVNSFLSRRLS